MAAFTNLIIKPQNLCSTTKLNTPFSWGYNPKLQSFFPTKPKISLPPLFITKAAATTSNVKNGSVGGGAAKAKEEDKVQHIHTVPEFEAALREAKQKLVVVEYAASHSKQSSKMYPFMVNLSKTCNDVVFLLVMGDESEETRELCRREKIDKVPHFSFYKNMEKIHDEEGIGPDMLEGDVLYYGDNHSGVAAFSSTSKLSIFFLFLGITSTVTADFNNEFDITWGDGRGKILNGDLLTLSLDKSSGSGFESRNEYLFGKIDMQLKLVPGNSAGTVTAYYLSSKGANWDEIDFEFLGNLSGDPYILHTNVFSQSKGNREQQFYLWFDPTADFHTYSILWNPQRIIFSVDGTPIREFKNGESIGVPFPKDQAMRIHSSLWNADDWATRGGLVKTDWSQAPFTASYRNFRADACVVSAGKSSCGGSASSGGSQAWLSEELDNTKQERLRWAQKNYMIYNYCSDSKRFPQGFPPECKMA